MDSNDLSRRGFLSTAVGAGATGTISGSESPHQPPERAWIIMEQRWHYNDEFYLPLHPWMAGACREFPRPTLPSCALSVTR